MIICALNIVVTILFATAYCLACWYLSHMSLCLALHDFLSCRHHLSHSTTRLVDYRLTGTWRGHVPWFFRRRRFINHLLTYLLTSYFFLLHTSFFLLSYFLFLLTSSNFLLLLTFYFLPYFLLLTSPYFLLLSFSYFFLLLLTSYLLTYSAFSQSQRFHYTRTISLNLNYRRRAVPSDNQSNNRSANPTNVAALPQYPYSFLGRLVIFGLPRARYAIIAAVGSSSVPRSYVEKKTEQDRPI